MHIYIYGKKGLIRMADEDVVKAQEPSPPKASNPFYSKTNVSHGESATRQIEKRPMKSASLKSMASFSRAPQATNILKNEDA